MLVVLILGTTTILLFISLVSVFMSQKHQLELEHNQTRNRSQEGCFVDDSANGGCATAATTTMGGQTTAASSANSYLGKNYCLTPDCVKVAASVIEAIDLTVDPCDDFYVSS